MALAAAGGHALRGRLARQGAGRVERLLRLPSHRRPWFAPGARSSGIGGRRTPDRLQQALVAPDEEVLPENRFVRLVTKDGATVTGRLLNQDAISVQLINPKEELKSYIRTNLRDYTVVDKGLMPSVQGKLTEQQVADIVSYLSSLQGT